MKRIDPWPLGLGLALLLFAAGVVGFAVFSSMQREDLVSGAYYDEEVRYQQQIDRERAVLESGAAPTVALDARRPVARVVFPAAAPRPEGGEIALYRPANAALDRTLPLRLDCARTQEIALAGLPSGLWRVRLRWQASGRDYAAEDVLVLP